MTRIIPTILCAAVCAVLVSAGRSPDGGRAIDIAQRASAGAPSGVSQDGMNRRLRVHNQTGWTIVHLLAAETGSDVWGGDLLRGQALTTGASWVGLIDDGAGACAFTLRAEFSNGQVLERPAVNVCRIADFYFTR